MQISPQEIRELFHDKGLRHTRQRELLYAALSATHTHPTAEELYRSVREADPGISLATVYNTLDALLNAGLCRKIVIGDGDNTARYDADITPHAHLVTCEGIHDLPEDLSRRLLSQIPASLVSEVEARLGIAIDRVNLQLHAARKPGDS